MAGESTPETRAVTQKVNERHTEVVKDDVHTTHRTGRLILSSNEELLDDTRMLGIVALIENGLPVKSSFSKMGINEYSSKEIVSVGRIYREYYDVNPTKYESKLAANSVKARAFIMNCIRIYMSIDEAKAEYENKLVQRVNDAVDENPEIALKVLATRYPDEWGAQKKVKVDVKKRIEIRTIRINPPQDVDEEIIEAEYEEIPNGS